MGLKLTDSLHVALLLLLLCVLSAEMAEPQTAETATFTVSDAALYSLLQPPNVSDPFVRTVELEFRTSAASSHLFSIGNENDEEFSISLNGSNRLSVSVNWRSPGTNGSSLTKQKMDLLAPGVANGEWHHLSVKLESGGKLVLDGEPLADLLSSNFTASFPYNDSVNIFFGLSFRGCLANASLDRVVRVPLHSQSELLNQTKFLKPTVIEVLPKTGSGCRQAPCPCEPRGVCIYKQWDLLDRCNCTRGYDPGALCRREWDTCKYLETGPPCLNGATCLNRPGVDEFLCFCATGFVGSRCQSIDLCKPQNPCQNGGFCILLGDDEHQESMDYSCLCSYGFRGKNCTDVIRDPNTHDTSTLIIALSTSLGLLFFMGLVGFGAFLVFRARSLRMNVANQGTKMQTR